MKKALTIIAACFVLFGPLSQTPASAATDPVVIAGAIDSYWARTFANNGDMYWSPIIVGVFDSKVTGCGFVDPWNFGPAAYCPADKHIYLSPVWFGPGTDDSFWYVALAHEWAHHIEGLLGYAASPSIESELRSDCMAGALLGDAVAQGYAPRTTYNGAFYLMLLLGDPDYLPAELDTHGSGADRAKSFNEGYSGGIANCNVGLS
ncbi:MAG: neutral zinc metallopeptidase [Thermomicrobiales bacterium]